MQEVKTIYAYDVDQIGADAFTLFYKRPELVSSWYQKYEYFLNPLNTHLFKEKLMKQVMIKKIIVNAGHWYRWQT